MLNEVLTTEVLMREIWELTRICELDFAPDLASLTQRLNQRNVKIVSLLKAGDVGGNNARLFGGAVVAREHANRVEIEAIMVEPCYRGKGNARKLINEIETKRRLVTWLEPNDFGSQYFFSACGFRGSGVCNGKIRYVRG